MGYYVLDKLGIDMQQRGLTSQVLQKVCRLYSANLT